MDNKIVTFLLGQRLFKTAIDISNTHGRMVCLRKIYGMICNKLGFRIGDMIRLYWFIIYITCHIKRSTVTSHSTTYRHIISVTWCIVESLVTQSNTKPDIDMDPAWIDNYMPSKMWNQIAYRFPTFNDTIVDVWQSISYMIPHSIMGVLTNSFCD